MTSKVKKRDALNSYRKELSQGASSKNGNKAYIWKSLLVVILAILCGVIHGKHAADMFERSTHFSHLADFEREMLFRTEMGFYYSFYKYLVNAKSFKEGLIALTRDNQTEYGREINALKRFNLYPEIIISAMYRVFKSITKYWKIPTQICWQVKRDVHLSPVTSCEGCFFKLANFSKPFTFAFGVVCVKFFIGKLLRTEDDAHIFDLLRAKIFGLHTFDTLLYTCAAEFDFLPFEYFKKTSATLLLPIAFVICISGVYILFFKQLLKENKTSKPISSSTAMIIFNMIQLACFALMAGMIMRLKLFLTPQMCIIVSLLFSEKFLCDIVGFQVKKRWFFAACIALLSCMSVAGIRNINEERNIIGEFENADMENLFDWINTRTLPNAVFACSIPLSANLKLTTERPIVIHPHYEDAELRKRTKQVYEMYSRRSPEKFIQALQKLHVNYLIIENWVCLKDSKDNCSQTDIWDYVDAKSRGKSESICRRLLADDQKFLPVVYSHGGYFVFKVQ
ncbi:putative C-mannosyltransferase DPY19L1, partial [Trichinella nativa]